MNWQVSSGSDLLDAEESLGEEYKDKGNTKYKAGEYEEAIKYYTKAIKADGEKTAAYYGNRSAAFMMLHKYHEAIADSHKATSLDAGFVKGYSRAGKCYLQLGQLLEAKKQYERARVLEPTNVQLKDEMDLLNRAERALKEGQTALAANNYHKAIAHLDIALQYCPYSESFKLLKLKALIELRQFQLALTLSR